MSSSLPLQTATPHHLLALPSKKELINEFVNKPLSQLRTPAFVIDRAIFAHNCAKMHQSAKDWGAQFRAHLKTHKTAEGARLQLNSSAGRTSAVIVSTVMEAWQVVKAGLVADGTVKDILYGLPVGLNKIADLSALWDEMAQYNAVLRLIVDHIDQVRALETFERGRPTTGPHRRWSVFVKVDGGQRRAGISPTSAAFESLLTSLLASPVISVYGFYCHAGNAYASTSLAEASTFLSAEVEAVNTAAGLALVILSVSPGVHHEQPFVLSVGSTPTAHAASATTKTQLASILHGPLELHAGNYPLLDLQQLNTGLISSEDIAQKVLATVISYYPSRGEGGTDEAICDAGGIAMSKDTGPSNGFGDVIGKPWRLDRISQEHGILTRIEGHSGGEEGAELTLGEIVHIIGQHACMIAAAYPWYYVVDSDSGECDKVVDIWVPWKGW